MSGALHTPRYAKFRKLLVEARKDAELTQNELSNKLGCSQSFVSKYEGGERRLDVIEFVDVCEALGIDPKEIFLEIKNGGVE